MGNSEAVTPPKSTKPFSPVQSQEQAANPPYSEWAAMQAYYRHGMMPPPYFSTAFAPGHPPHPYIWGPQPLIPPPFGSPYAAIYPHGGVYSHPSVPHNSHAHCGITPSTTANEAVVMATPLGMETSAKSSKNKDKKPVKKLKGVDGIAMPGGNSSTDNKDQAGGNSGYNSTEDSSDGSDRDDAEGGTNSQRKRISNDIASSENAKISGQVNPGHPEETDTNSKAAAGVTGATAIPAKPVGTLPSSAPAPGMGIQVSNASKVKAIGTPVPLATTAVISGQNGIPSELWLQDDREIKRERRKLSNRESARRSRLRKQAETEELAQKVESLIEENSNLRTEISCLTENSEKLKLENSVLVEELKIVQPSDHSNMNNVRIAPVVAENFLSMIENQGSISRPTKQREGDADGKSTKKLRQLLNSSPRRDAVAAS